MKPLSTVGRLPLDTPGHHSIMSKPDFVTITSSRVCNYGNCRAALKIQNISFILYQVILSRASQVALVVMNPLANAGDVRDMGLISRSGRSPGEGHGNPLQYSCLENPWTDEPGGLQSVGTQRIGYDWSDLACTHNLSIRLRINKTNKTGRLQKDDEGNALAIRYKYNYCSQTLTFGGNMTG